MKKSILTILILIVLLITLVNANSPPKLIKPIENLTFDIYESKIRILNLNDYFKDNETLTYTYEGNKNITILISENGELSLITPNGWYGNENITFIASDNELETKSNKVKIEVISEIYGCEGQCCNIDCGTTEKVCNNNIKTRCKNFCVEGKCIPCSPICNNKLTTNINFPSLVGDSFIDTIPCINTSDKRDKITKKQINLVKNLIPEGYEIIREPFNLECSGKASITVNLPSDYTDIKTLKCKKGTCYPEELTPTNTLNCGEKITDNIRKNNILKPEIMPIKIKETSLLPKESRIISDDIKIEFYNNNENLKASIRMPKRPIKEAANPSLKIVTTPIILNINEKTDINITIQYISSNNIDENTIGFYIKKGDIWKYLKGEINKEEKTATVYIEGMNNYSDKNNDVIITLMGIICNNCFKSKFKKEYTPLQDSKDMIVMIHGLASRPETFQELIDEFRLTNQPYHIYTLGHSSYTPIRKTSDELREYLNIESENYDNIYLIAHSMGGLITQQAIYKAYLENKKDPTKSKFINKVKKTILISVPNEGTPVAQFYYELFDYLVNQDSPYAANELNSAIIEEITQGLITPRIPHIEYYVIAGTKTYPMVKKLSKISGDLFDGIKNDGVVSVKSAQRIGDQYFNKICENYWEFNLSHSETIDEARPRKVITSLITQEKEFSLGNNKYYDIEIDECNDDDIYVIIGKKTNPQPTHKLYCGECGDGYCSSKESIFNCAADCSTIKTIPIKWIIISFITTLVIIFHIKLIPKKISMIKRKNQILHQAEILKLHTIKNYHINTTTGHTIEQLKYELRNEGWHVEVIEQFIHKLKNIYRKKYGEIDLRFLKINPVLKNKKGSEYFNIN